MVIGRDKNLGEISGSCPHHVPGVQHQRSGEDRPADQRQMGYNPTRKIDIGYRSVVRAQPLGQGRQRAAKSVGGINDGLRYDHNTGDGCPAVRSSGKPRVCQVDQARSDPEEGDRVHGLHRDQTHASPSAVRLAALPHCASPLIA